MVGFNVDEMSGKITGAFSQDLKIKERLYTSNGFNVGMTLPNLSAQNLGQIGKQKSTPAPANLGQDFDEIESHLSEENHNPSSKEGL